MIEVEEQFWWFVARASGMVAWVMLIAAVFWGILVTTDLFVKWRRPAWLLDLHRHLGGLSLLFLAIHLVALVADSYVEFGLVELAIPMASEYKPEAVALGVVATWGLIAVELTSLARRRLPKRLWRSIHLISYVVFWLGSLHGTYAGTDAANPVYLIGSSASVVGVIFAVVYRILNGRRRRRPKTGDKARTGTASAPNKPKRPLVTVTYPESRG